MVPRVAAKWCRSVAALPNPTRVAICSTDSVVCSRSSSARASRWPVSHCSGVVPVSSRNRRANVRGDMCASSRQPLDRHRLVEMLRRPREQRARGVGFGLAHRRPDELRLAAVAMRRDDHAAGGGGGDAGAELATHQVQRRVDAGGRAGAGEDVAVKT